MIPPLRRLFGMIALVVFVVVYAFFAMVIGDMSLQQSSTPVKLIYYAISGLIWIVPAGAIISWMYRKPKQD